jgi:hypothetical protein
VHATVELVQIRTIVFLHITGARTAIPGCGICAAMSMLDAVELIRIAAVSLLMALALAGYYNPRSACRRAISMNWSTVLG